MFDGVCLPYSRCRTAVDFNGVTRGTDGRTIDDLLTVVSKNFVGEMITNSFSKTDKTARPLMGFGGNLGLVWVPRDSAVAKYTGSQNSNWKTLEMSGVFHGGLHRVCANQELLY